LLRAKHNARMQRGATTGLEPPDAQNGWKHLVLRAETRGYAVIVIRWIARAGE